MARLFHYSDSGWKAAALAFECLALACAAAAQTDSSTAKIITLNKKAAASLILLQPKPEYPPLAKVNYIQGKVRLQVLVSPEGKVIEANVFQGHPFLAAAALNAVRHWLYMPLKTAAGAVPFVAMVDVNFALHSIKIEQLPPRAEQDLSRQIHPPEMLKKPPANSPLVHIRVLVNDSGEAIDVNPVGGFPIQYDSALKLVEQCKFQPAHWGPLAVPWYLDVDVPAGNPPASVVGRGKE
jgi:protein TonB